MSRPSWDLVMVCYGSLISYHRLDVRHFWASFTGRLLVSGYKSGWTWGLRTSLKFVACCWFSGEASQGVPWIQTLHRFSHESCRAMGFHPHIWSKKIGFDLTHPIWQCVNDQKSNCWNTPMNKSNTYPLNICHKILHWSLMIVLAINFRWCRGC